MTLLKRLTLLAVILTSFGTARASHLIGGYISYEHISGNQFEVTVRLWRDMSGINLPASANIDFYHDVSPYNPANIFAGTNNATLPMISSGPVTLGDSCYSPTGLDIEEGVYQDILTIPNSPDGYYIIFDDCCRNGSITNITGPSSAGFSIVTEMPDPALGNSSPSIGTYPSDGYFCANYTNYITEMAATDPNTGDSLSYSLVTPLDDGNQIKPFTNVNWAAPYSLADIVGGTTPMVIDPLSGVIVADPTLLGGVFVFSVEIEEFRNGVKIGEVRIDVQYQVLNCQLPGAPELVEMSNIDTSLVGNIPYTSYIMEIPVGVDTCTDVVIEALDSSDILFVQIDTNTSNFLQNATGISWNQGNLISTVPDTTRVYTIWDPNSQQYVTDTIVGQSLTDSNYVRNVHRVGHQFCYSLICKDLDSLYWVDFDIITKFADSCADSFLDTVRRRVFFRPYLPPDQGPTIFGLQSHYNVQVLDEVCIPLYIYDPDQGDSLYASTVSNTFGRGAEFYQDEIVNGQIQQIVWNDTFYVKPNKLTAEGDFVNTTDMALDYCWQTECEHLDPGKYVLAVSAWSMDYCRIDTNFAYDTATFNVYPLPAENNNIPNVFSPNGDGVNDYFMFDGISDPCFDSVNVKIYSRWGKLVYETTDPVFQWDGKNKAGNDCPEGTYYILLEGMYGREPVDRQYPVTLFR